MNNFVLQPLFERLFRRYRSSVTVTTPYPGTVLDFPLVMDKETLNIMPSLPRETVVSIATNAIKGNVDDMLTLSMMYSVGLGVPCIETCAQAWSFFALTQPSIMSFKKAVRLLKEHLETLPKGDHQYPEILTAIYSKLTPSFNLIELGAIPEGPVIVTPLLAGIRTFLVYRVKEHDDGKHCYLYDMRVGGVGGERVCLELANKLDVPLYLGAIRGEPTIPDYPERVSEFLRGPASYFVVAGTLVIPNSKKELVNRIWPDVRSAYQLMDELFAMGSVERRPHTNIQKYAQAILRLERLEDEAKEIESGDLVDSLRTQYNKRVAFLKKAKVVKTEEEIEALREEALALKEYARKVKSGEREKEIETEKEVLEKRLPKLKARNASAKSEHDAQYPENLFKFVATDLYYGRRGDVELMPLGRSIDRHLASLGFTNFSHSMLQAYTAMSCKNGIDKSVFKSAMQRFTEYYPEYNVSGLVIRHKPITVNRTGEQLPAYVVTHNKG